jgi:hypothetical protein
MRFQLQIKWLVIPMISAIIFLVLTTYGNTFKIADSQNSNIEMNNNQAQIVSDILPTNVVLNYNNTDYHGKVISYKYREGYSFNESDLSIENLTKHFSNQNSILIPINNNFNS